MQTDAMDFSFAASQITRSPRRNAAASGVVGWSRKSAAAAAARTARPRTRKITSPASRRTWPRSCEAITILMPDCARHQHDLLDAAGRGGIEVGGRLVEQQHFRIARQRACQRQPLLLAAGQPPRRPLRQIGQPDALQQGGDARGALRVRHARLRQRVGDVGGGGPSQHHRALKQDRATAPARDRRGRPR